MAEFIAANRAGLVNRLRSLSIGDSLLVPGRTTHDVHNHMRAARRGGEKWFQSRTLTTGVRIWRTE